MRSAGPGFGEKQATEGGGTRASLLRVAVGVALVVLLWAGFLGAQERGGQPGRLAGRLFDAERTERPVVGEVELPELGRSTRTDQHGRFRLEALPPGRYRLRATSPAHHDLQRQVDVEAGEEVRVELSLVPVLFRLDEIVASASPLDGGSAYQPAVALSAEELGRRAGASLGAVVDGAPGISLRSFGPAPGRPVVRGLDGDRVLVLENGERMGDLGETAADHAVSTDPLSVERVEIVRGPASLLYGSSALGGVVNVLDRDIPVDWHPGPQGRLAAHLASANRLGALSGRGTWGLGPMGVSGRVSLRRSGNESTPLGRIPDTEGFQRTGALGFAVEGDAAEVGGSLGVLAHDYGLPEAVDDPDERVEIRMARENARGRGSWEGPGALREVELRVSASRYRHEEVAIHEVPAAATQKEVDLEFAQRSLSSTLTARHASFGSGGEGVLGASLYRGALEVRGVDALTPDSRRLFLAGFIYHDVPVREWASLQAGLRTELQRARATPNERFPGLRERRSDLTHAGSIGVRATPLPALEVRFQLARSHRAPLPEELYSDAPHLGTGQYEIGDPDLVHERGVGADLFVRMGGDRFRSELALFHNRIRDFVILAPVGEVHEPSGLPVFAYEADEARLRGAEAAVDVRLTRTVWGGATLDHVRGDRIGAVPSPLPFMPPSRLGLELRRETASWWAGGRVRLVDRQDRVAEDEEPTPGYGRVDLEGGVRLRTDGGLHLFVLRIDNALDGTHHDHLSRVRDRGFPRPGRNLNLVYIWTP